MIYLSSYFSSIINPPPHTIYKDIKKNMNPVHEYRQNQCKNSKRTVS